MSSHIFNLDNELNSFIINFFGGLSALVLSVVQL
jgi:hypothetical protein